MKRNKAMDPVEADRLSRDILRENAEWERRQAAPDDYRELLVQLMEERHTMPLDSLWATYQFVKGEELPPQMPDYEKAATRARWGRAHRLSNILGQHGVEVFNEVLAEANRDEDEQELWEEQHYGQALTSFLVSYYA